MSAADLLSVLTPSVGAASGVQPVAAVSGADAEAFAALLAQNSGQPEDGATPQKLTGTTEQLAGAPTDQAQAANQNASMVVAPTAPVLVIAPWLQPAPVEPQKGETAEAGSVISGADESLSEGMNQTGALKDASNKAAEKAAVIGSAPAIPAAVTQGSIPNLALEPASPPAAASFAVTGAPSQPRTLINSHLLADAQIAQPLAMEPAADVQTSPASADEPQATRNANAPTDKPAAPVALTAHEATPKDATPVAERASTVANADPQKKPLNNPSPSATAESPEAALNAPTAKTVARSVPMTPAPQGEANPDTALNKAMVKDAPAPALHAASSSMAPEAQTSAPAQLAEQPSAARAALNLTGAMSAAVTVTSAIEADAVEAHPAPQAQTETQKPAAQPAPAPTAMTQVMTQAMFQAAVQASLTPRPLKAAPAADVAPEPGQGTDASADSAPEGEKTAPEPAPLALTRGARLDAEARLQTAIRDSGGKPSDTVKTGLIETPAAKSSPAVASSQPLAQNASGQTAPAIPAAPTAPVATPALSMDAAVAPEITTVQALQSDTAALSSPLRDHGMSSLSRATAETTAALAAQIARRMDARSTRFDMVLTPEGLGRVDVSLDIASDGRLTARLAFDNPNAANEMKGRADELRRQLEDSGFQLADDALDFSQRDPSSSGGGFDRRRGNAFASASRIAADAEIAAAPVAARWLSSTQTPDGVDMKV